MQHKQIFKTALLALVLILGRSELCSQAFAAGNEPQYPLDLSLHEQDSNSQFLIGVELTQLSVASTSFSGVGIRLGYEYGLNQNWSILPAVALVTEASGSQGFLYSSVEATVRYSIFGSLYKSKREILRAGVPIVSQTDERQNRLSLSAGLEQLFLNGASSVYPAAGPTIGVAYSFQVFRQWSEVSLRAADMTAGSRSVSAVFVGFSLLFGN